MPLEVTFSQDDIQTIIDANNSPQFGPRNKALIICASYWGLDRKEICQLPLNALMSESGSWYKRWVLPEEFSFHGEARELCTADHVIPALDVYVDWLKSKEVGGSNLHTYRQLDGEMKFIVNDNYKPFALTKRKKPLNDGAVSYQTRALDDKLKGFILNAGIQGARVSTFRDSWVKMMYDNGCGYNELKSVSGIKTKSTLDAKIRPLERELQQIFNSVFSRIN